MEPDSPAPKGLREKMHDMRSRLLGAMAKNVNRSDQVTSQQAERVHQAAEQISQQGASKQTGPEPRTRWDDK